MGGRAMSVARGSGAPRQEVTRLEQNVSIIEVDIDTVSNISDLQNYSNVTLTQAQEVQITVPEN